MNKREAREIADRWLSDLMISRDNEFIEYLSKEIQKVHLKAIEKAEVLEGAIQDILYRLKFDSDAIGRAKPTREKLIVDDALAKWGKEK